VSARGPIRRRETCNKPSPYFQRVGMPATTAFRLHGLEPCPVVTLISGVKSRQVCHRDGLPDLSVPFMRPASASQHHVEEDLMRGEWREWPHKGFDLLSTYLGPLQAR